MGYPPQPHSQDLWGQQAQGAPQGYGRPGYGPPPVPGRRPDPQGRHGAPDPQYPQDRYDPRGPYGHQDPYATRIQYGHDDPYGPPHAPFDYDLPPRRNNTLVIVLSLGVGLLLLGGGTVGAVSYLNSSDPRPAALPSGTTFPTTAPWQSDSPSAAPSQEPSDPVTEPTDSPSPAESPSGSQRAVPGSPISAGEFDDWRFELDGVRFSADKVDGWTYDTCDPVDAQGVLARNKCERAIQVAYTAYRGHLKAVQVMMSFPTDKAAKATATQIAKLTADPVNIRRDMAHTNYAYGKIRTNVAKNYLVVTVVTTDRTARSRAEKFHLYMQADFMSYLMLRDVTVTS